MFTLSGLNIVELRTVNSMYANNQIEAIDDKGVVYRMLVSTIIQMLNEFKFKIKKKRKYPHLVEALLVEDQS